MGSLEAGTEEIDKLKQEMIGQVNPNDLHSNQKIQEINRQRSHQRNVDSHSMNMLQALNKSDSHSCLQTLDLLNVPASEKDVKEICYYNRIPRVYVPDDAEELEDGGKVAEYATLAFKENPDRPKPDPLYRVFIQTLNDKSENFS
jgi:hypothetical protein